MNKIPNFNTFVHYEFIKETHEIVKDYMSYDELNEIVGKQFLDFIKGVFTNPIQKRKLDKLAKELLKIKIELMRLEIEEDSIDSLKSQLNTSKKGNSYSTSNSKIDIADKAKQIKIKSLQDKEETIIDQMDDIGKASDKLQKYVDKVKFETRIKANDATIRIADGEIEKVLKNLKAEDLKTTKELTQEITK